MIKTFNPHYQELEKRAKEENCFIDYQHLTATKEYGAVMCTVSNADGKRVCRMAGNSDITVAQEEAGYMALCTFYGEEIKGVAPVNAGQPQVAQGNRQQAQATQQRSAQTQPQAGTAGERASQPQAGAGNRTPNAEQGNQQPVQQRQTAGPRQAGSAPVTPTNRTQTRNTPTGNGQQAQPTQQRPQGGNAVPAAQPNRAQGTPGNQRGTTAPQQAQTTQQTQPQAGNTGNANVANNGGTTNAAPVNTEAHAADDFQVTLGNFKYKTNNWISVLVKDEVCLNTLRKMANMSNPMDERLKAPIQKVRQYLEAHHLM